MKEQDIHSLSNGGSGEECNGEDGGELHVLLKVIVGGDVVVRPAEE